MPKKYPGYFNGRKCCVCGSDLSIGYDHGIKYIDEDKNWTGKWSCHNCYTKNRYTRIKNVKLEMRVCYLCSRKDTYVLPNGTEVWHKSDIVDNEWLCHSCYNKGRMKLPDSHNNLIKSMAKSRNKQLDRNCTRGKGFIAEQIVAKKLNIKNCNLDKDNFNCNIDLYDPIVYRMIQVKSSSLKNGECKIGGIKKGFDHLFILCMSNDYKNIEMMYIIPEKDIGDRSSIWITKYPLRGIPWYENFRVDEKPYNDVYHNMNIEDCVILKDNK